uniref:Uncharacterized protein n=1 Tax=viral metagenome TaxID=1070528 RepID=A0A6C0E9J8_9ZZZZ
MSLCGGYDASKIGRSRTYDSDFPHVYMHDMCYTARSIICEWQVDVCSLLKSICKCVDG